MPIYHHKVSKNRERLYGLYIYTTYIYSIYTDLALISGIYPTVISRVSYGYPTVKVVE